MRAKQEVIYLEQNQKTLRHSQELRRNMTKEERHLWYDFLKTYPVQFKRQYAIGVYIVDFYCYKARLILELDGAQHCTPENVEYDRIRTKYLEQQGNYVLRLSNRDVMSQFPSVCETIHIAVHDRMRGLPSSDPAVAGPPSPRGRLFGRSF